MNHTNKLLFAIYFLAQGSIAQVQSAAVKPGPVTPIKPSNPVRTEPIKPTPTPAPPPKKTLDRRQLDLIVRKATNDFTRDILDILGDAYQVRYNVREGLLKAATRLGNYEADYILRSTPEFNNALILGRTDGKNAGESAGQSAANSQSRSIAQSEINAAIDHTLDSGSAMQFKQNPKMVSFVGAASPLPYPRGIESRIVEDESQKNYQIRRLLRYDPPSTYLSGLLDLSSIYRFHSLDLPSDFRISNIFQTWFDNELRTNSHSSSEARNFYREITNASLFEVAAENGIFFRNSFESHMDLERPWSRRVTNPHINALNLGEELYFQAAAAYAHDRGYHQGYNDVFSVASVSAFNRSYLDLYRSNYAAIENNVRSSSVISEIDAEVISEDGKSEVTYGDSFIVVVKRIANRGMVEANVEVEIPDQNQVTSFKNKLSIPVNGLTRINQPKTSARMGWISALTAPDQLIAISARIHGTTVTLSAKATYEELLRKTLRTSSPEHVQFMMNIALQFMKKQYDDISGFRDQYANRDAGMLLVRMRKLFDSLNENEKAQLRLHGQSIRNVFGGKPNRFLNPKRDEWDATQAMINEMGLPGNVPSQVNEASSNRNN